MLTKSKTVRELLSEVLDEETLAAAIANMEDSPDRISIIQENPAALMAAFTWSATPQGFDFWNNLYNELCAPASTR